MEKTKASMVVMSHLSDAQEMLNQNPRWVNNHINFVKFVIMQYKGDLTQEIDVEKLWLDFTNTKFFRGDIFKHPELKENEIFLVNVREGEDWEKNLKTHFKSLRRGNIAYVTDGSEVVPDHKPLFGIPK